METHEIVKKLVSALVDARGYSFATGYLESTLGDIISKYVKDETELHMLHIRLLGKAIDVKLEKKAD